MADDALTLRAEVVDRASGPLKALQRQLQDVAKGAGPHLKNLRKDLEEVQSHMAKTATVAKDLLNPALAGLGVATLSIGGALAGVGAAMRGFSADTTGLSYLSREVGISAGKLRELQSVAGRFNLDPGSIDKSVRYFADQIDQMHRNRGEAYNYLLQQGAKDPTGQVSSWAKSIKEATSNAEAYQRALEMIASVRDPQQRGDLAEKLLGDRSLGQLGSEGLAGLRKQLAESEKDLGTFKKAAESAAIEFGRGIQSMRDQLRGLRDDMGPDLIKPLNEGLRELGGWLREHKGEIRDTLANGFRDVGKFLKETNWQEIGGGLTTMLHGVSVAALATANAVRGVVQAGQDFRASLDRLGITNAPRERRITEIDTDIATLRENRKHAHDGIFGKVLGGRAERDIDANIAALQAEKQRLVEERNTEEVKKNTEELKRRREREDRDGDKAKVDPSAFDGTAPGDAARILKASFGGGRIYGGGSPGNGDAGGYGGVREGLKRRDGGIDVGDGLRGRPFGHPAPAGQGSPSEPPAVGGYTGNDGRRAARSALSAAGRDNVASWMQFFRKPVSEGGMGYTEEQARGQIAMMQGESGLNLNPAAMGDRDRRGVPHAFGTVQWSDAKGNDRFPRLRALAAEMGKDWRDRSVQQQMYRREMLGRYRNVYGRIIASQRGEQSLWAGITGYENPREHSLAYAIRRPFLERLRRDGSATASQKPVEKRSDLMGRARAAGLVGSVAKAEGHVQVHVNAPKGWSTKTANAGSLFREVKLNRGNAMQLASQEA